MYEMVKGVPRKNMHGTICWWTKGWYGTLERKNACGWNKTAGMYSTMEHNPYTS
jgi:hypothetical protein